MTDPSYWTCNEVSDWLKNNGFQKYAQLLCEEHQIDGQGLLSLSENDLKQPPIGIRVLGDIKRLCQQVKTLKSKSFGKKNGTIAEPSKIVDLPKETILQIVENSNFQTGLPDSECNGFHPCNYSKNSRNIDPEKHKVLFGLIYSVFGLLCTSFCIVVVQSKAPDQQKHPPLPDVFLDRFPEVSWAYKVSDGMLLLLTATWLAVVILHKHRWILMRRTFCLLGSMYLLRCVCILITQLPVPESNVKCDRKNYTSFMAKAGRALEIFFGGGMKVSGLRTCGDYMFSGHTVILTLLNFLITEYTPKRLCFIHIGSWMANIFGMFFILAGHGHYSIDVFVAFVLTSRLFCYYHTLANNIALMNNDAKRIKLWFPLFMYFECNSTGVIPHEFEWPLPLWSKLKNYLRGYELVSAKEKS